MLNEITAVAALATAANAFLVPSNMLPADHAVPAALDPITAMRVQHNQVKVSLDCRDCPAAQDVPDFIATADGPHDVTLDLDFTLNPDRTALNLANVQLFPMTRDGNWDLVLDQVFHDVDTSMGHFPTFSVVTPPKIGYNVAANIIEAADGSEGELINLDLQVVYIDNHPINVDAVHVRLLKSEDEGRLSIVDIVRVPNQVERVERPSIPGPGPMQESAAEICGTGLASVPCRARLLIGATRAALFGHPVPAPHPAGPRPCHKFDGAQLIGLSPAEIRLVGSGLPREMIDELRAANGDRMVTDLSPEAVHKLFQLPDGPVPADAADNPVFLKTLEVIAAIREHGPPKPKVPMHGGPAKFWQPLAGDGPVRVDKDDGADFHAMPFFHPFRPNGPGDMPEVEAGPFRFPHHHPHGHHGPPPDFGGFLAKHGREPSPMDRIGCAVRNFVMNILLPMVIGVAAGITISGVGFVLGMGVLALWRAFFRRNGAVDEMLDVEEKKELMVEDGDVVLEEEDLPVYSEKAEEA